MVWIFGVSFPLVSSAKVSSESRISCVFVCDWPGLNPPPLHQAVRVSRRSEMPTSRLLKGLLTARCDSSLHSPLFLFIYVLFLFLSSLFPPLSQPCLWCMCFACCGVSLFVLSLFSLCLLIIFSRKAFFFLINFPCVSLCTLQTPCLVQFSSLSF